MTFSEKITATVHRLAESRKAVATIGANILATAPFVLHWLTMIPNWDQAATDTFNTDVRIIAGVLTASAAWLAKTFADEGPRAAAVPAPADQPAPAPAPAAPAPAPEVTPRG